MAISYINKGLKFAEEISNNLLCIVGYRLGGICCFLSSIKKYYIIQGECALENYIRHRQKDGLSERNIFEQFDQVHLLMDKLVAMEESDSYKYFRYNG